MIKSLISQRMLMNILVGPLSWPARLVVKQPLLLTRPATQPMQFKILSLNIRLGILIKNQQYKNGKNNSKVHLPIFWWQWVWLHSSWQPFICWQLDCKWYILNMERCYVVLGIKYIIKSTMTDHIHLEREWYSISDTQFGFLYSE